MGFRSLLAKPFAAYVINARRKWEKNAVETQLSLMKSLVSEAAYTLFGKDHHFDEIADYQTFKNNVPVKDYESLRPYIEMVVAGQEDILWKGKPLYFAKTSGTTSGVKYIPISKESIGFHINGARDALLSYVHETGNSQFLDKKLLWKQSARAYKSYFSACLPRPNKVIKIHFSRRIRTSPGQKSAINSDWAI